MMEETGRLRDQAAISYKYHRKRQGFYSSLDGISKVVALIAITTLASTQLHAAANWFIAISSVLLTVFSISLDFSGRAALHKLFAERFAKLRTKISQNPDDASLWKRFYEIQQDEPPIITSVAQVCQDEWEYVKGCAVEPERLTPCRKFLANFGIGEFPPRAQPDKQEEKIT